MVLSSPSKADNVWRLVAGLWLIVIAWPGSSWASTDEVPRYCQTLLQGQIPEIGEKLEPLAPAQPGPACDIQCAFTVAEIMRRQIRSDQRPADLLERSALGLEPIVARSLSRRPSPLLKTEEMGGLINFALRGDHLDSYVRVRAMELSPHTEDFFLLKRELFVLVLYTPEQATEFSRVIVFSIEGSRVVGFDPARGTTETMSLISKDSLSLKRDELKSGTSSAPEHLIVAGHRVSFEETYAPPEGNPKALAWIQRYNELIRRLNLLKTFVFNPNQIRSPKSGLSPQVIIDRIFSNWNFARKLLASDLWHGNSAVDALRFEARLHLHEFEEMVRASKFLQWSIDLGLLHRARHHAEVGLTESLLRELEGQNLDRIEQLKRLPEVSTLDLELLLGPALAGYWELGEILKALDPNLNAEQVHRRLDAYFLALISATKSPSVSKALHGFDSSKIRGLRSQMAKILDRRGRSSWPW